jgi:RNA polymerase sigma-70 factor (ECF subfamily)
MVSWLYSSHTECAICSARSVKQIVDPKELQAIEACQSGRLERFDDLYRQYIDRIYKFVYFKTFHRETAEDVTSDVFMKALERIDQFDQTKGTFSAWLYRIARNTVIDHYRTTHPTEEIEDGWSLSSSTNIEHDAEVHASLEKIQQALSVLKPEQREVVVMRLWDGLSHQEIAEILGMTESNTKQIFSRTIRKLREDYGSTFIIALIFISQFGIRK